MFGFFFKKCLFSICEKFNREREMIIYNFYRKRYIEEKVI